MRFVGAFIILASIVEWGLGGFVYSFFVFPKLGGWWGAILPFIAGVLFLLGWNKGYIIAGCVFSSIGLLITAIAAGVDGVAANIFRQFTCCANIEKSGSITIYGDKTGACAASVTAYFTLYPNYAPSHCACNNNPSGNPGNGMYFVPLTYELVDHTGGSDPNTCGDILTLYTPALAASTGFLAFLVIVVFIASVLSCSSLCCAPKVSLAAEDASKAGNAATLEPPVVSVNDAQYAGNKA